MYLLTSRIHGRSKRAAVRFAIVGFLGTVLQFACYDILLRIFPGIMEELAMTIAFVLEAVVNYLLSNFYTFSTRPTATNLGGFLFARLFNYLVQMFFLWLLLCFLGPQISGILSIALAGLVNYFVMHFVFNRTKSKTPA